MLRPSRARMLSIALHWSVAILFLLRAVARDGAMAHILGGLLAIAVIAWIALMMAIGQRARPTQDLPPALRIAHLAIHRGLIGALGLLVLVGLPGGLAGPGMAATLGGPSDQAALWLGRLIYAVGGLALAHFLFNAWREAALGARVFQRMIPF